MTRREFLKLAAASVAAAALPSAASAHPRASAPRLKKCVMLGFDGMDPELTRRLVSEGRLPNLAKLMSAGRFRSLATSDPPQSPVAWSNVISGANPGVHGIYDFIAREAATRIAYLSTSRASGPSRTFKLGGYTFPISGGGIENLREGPCLWHLLEKGGVPCTVLRMPSNFPPAPAARRALSGLGTPDIHGAYGIFSFYTDRQGERTRDVSGGRIERMRLSGGHAQCELRGPDNPFAPAKGRVDCPFDVWASAESRSVRIRIQDRDFVISEGEWTPWIDIRFSLVPGLASASGIVRFLLKHAGGPFELYATPVNIDPAKPAFPISSPPDYSADLSFRIGRFYTQGMAEDTSALSAGVFTDDDFRSQALMVHDESVRILEAEYNRFREGLFFAYFSTLDQNSHAFWRALDPRHPLYTPELAAAHGDALPDLYARMDAVAGRILDSCDPADTLFILLSDHGFTSFRRQFNVNTWLLDNGYAALTNRDAGAETDYFAATRWGDTSAYGLGINSLYLNLRGREPDGCVSTGDFDSLRNEIARKLEAYVDPATGEHPVHRAYRPDEIFHGPCAGRAPDLVLGYNAGWRASWSTILGTYSREICEDNLDPWSGDHCMDSQFMPGVLFANRDIASRSPALVDIAPSILSAFGLPSDPLMDGNDIWA